MKDTPPAPSPSSPPTDTDNTCYANLICCTDRVRATLRLTVSIPVAPEEHKERTQEDHGQGGWLVHFVTGCVNTARKAPGHRAQGTTFQVRYKRNTRGKEGKKKETRKKAGKKAGSTDERVRLSQSEGCQSVRLERRPRGEGLGTSSIT